MHRQGFRCFTTLFVLCSALAGCGNVASQPATALPASRCGGGDEGRCIVLEPSPHDRENILAALIDARPGDVLFLKAGLYHVDGQLLLDVPDVTLRGEGLDRTILSFANQTDGGEGLLVTGDRFTMADLALEDGPGDLIRLLGVDGVRLTRVRAEWTQGPATDNGAYGLYPVQCNNVLIEDSVVRGASDAGVYVGQSTNIIVRRNTVEYNVAGIEIENSTGADVYENIVTNNTGGVLVFNLPGIPVQDGRATRIFRNRIFVNDTPNFAYPGNIVASVPAGTGIMLMANDDVEVFDNELRDNGTVAVLTISYNTAALVAGIKRPADPTYDPYSEGILIADNDFIGGGTKPDAATADLIRGVAPVVGDGPMPQVILDGDIDPSKLENGMLPAALRTCLTDEAASFVNLDIGNGFVGATTDATAVRCSLASLPAIVVPGSEAELPAVDQPGALAPTVQLPLGNDVSESRCTPPAGGKAWIDVEDLSCQLLSSHRFFRGDGASQQPNGDVVPFDVATPLFSDEAWKHRFVYLPEGTAAVYHETAAFDFPIGTALIKTFAYPHDARDPALGERLIETRLLVRRADRWVGITYRWNDAQTEAVLTTVGADVPVSWIDATGTERNVAFHVPNVNQCKACHSETGSTGPLGPKARNLNKSFDYADGPANQLDHWRDLGILAGSPGSDAAPPSVVYDDPSTGSLEARARTYLDVNCGSCHSAEGLARPSGLLLTVHETDPNKLGFCKTPVSAGRGSGGRAYDIVPGQPDESILVYRMASTEAGVAMPELGRMLVHEAGVDVIRAWITSLPGSCEPSA